MASASLTFSADAHTYELDGVRVPSVTTVLRASGLIDFNGIPRPILEAARRRGTIVHQAIHFYNEDDLDLETFERDFPSYAGYLRSWIALAESGRLQTVLCEHRVASRKYRYAGTIDWLGVFDGHGAILDFATGDPEDCAKDLQTAGYLSAALEWSREVGEEALAAFIKSQRFLARYSVRLRKDGRLPTPEPYPDARHTAEFLTLVTAQHIVQTRRPKAVDWTSFAA